MVYTKDMELHLMGTVKLRSGESCSPPTDIKIGDRELLEHTGK